MGLLDGTIHREYYQGNDLGNYQFTSLDDIITQFEIAYVGDNKIIPKIKRADIAFHAQRALQELSFDTLKSVKSQQIDVPATLTMPLPHDYVNYTRLSWVDTAGIKHPLYHTKHTSNPFQVKQETDGTYSFPSGQEILVNNDFSNAVDYVPDDWTILAYSRNIGGNYGTGTGVVDGKLMWSYNSKDGYGDFATFVSVAYQAIDVSNIDFLDISADGVTADISYTNDSGTSGTATGIVRFGLSTILPDGTNLAHPVNPSWADSPLVSTNIFDITNVDGENSYLEWTGTESSTKELKSLNVSTLNTVYVLALSFVELTTRLDWGFALKPDGVTAVDGTGVINGTMNTANVNSLDNLSVTNALAMSDIQLATGNETNSSTWNSYKSTTPSENNNEDYEDDIYWPLDGERYGLDPQHAQVNGSFYVDNRLGKINFSSNISGKTVILDYISDSLGTDAEMQVHKFAEEAMYKCIAHAILSTSSYGQAVVPRLTKEKFAAVRKAKLRLSGLKLEELTQILRGKSKQIKH